ncbi:hypothetical protein [Streptomyces griseoloalbus]|uniref:Pheromone shutdown protein TraB n=1 Tax=Streptomyces griseoloalbus TaxID=67303 RepID=A0A7W8FCZ1_9ACTN|nr:hypothetical protein [Streptomyces albaduncus]MBB5129844.1 pheromone shutdown protein TraB [Streptomyces albaduncus]GGW76786.1 hypothetical protein GCM10010340_64350 [Streptomyces albaduncus]
MKVKRIDLDEEEMPERVLVELSHDEAAYLALLIGKQNSTDMNEVMPGGTSQGGAIYDGLTGSLFNRFYEDGVDGAARAIRVRP